MWIAFIGVTALIALSVSAQNPGFLSLDCGGTQSFVDDLGIEWVPDDKYITTGSVASVSSEYSPSREYERLRYFPPNRKHCYALPVIANRTYLVRPSFFYGNYDGLENPPSFDLQIGANTFGSTFFKGSNTTWYLEYILAAPDDTLNFCVASTSASSVPFISALELRLMGPGMYKTYEANQALIMLRRMNVGATSSDDIRYPDDKYDRIWRSDEDFNTYPIITTNSTISPGKRDQPPSLVMQTAITANTSIAFNFPFSMSTGTKYYAAFYFAEFATLSSNQVREFDVYINDTSSEVLWFGPINIQKYFNGSSLVALELYHKALTVNGAASFLFLPTNRSTLGPIINAAEIFRVLSNLSPGTHPDDVRAINAIKSQFNLLGWSGDPCLPVGYAWDWITCNFKEVPSRIIALNLSNFHLNGTIPQNLTRLTHLTKILLDNNNLQGFIPDFSSLKNLSILHLQNNNLSGSIPNSLLKIPNLQELSLQNNSLNACFLQQSVRTGLTVNASSNPCSTNLKMQKEPKKKTRTSTIILSAAIPSAVVLLLLGVLLTALLCKKAATTTDSRTNDDDGRKKKIISPRKFTYNEIVKATDNLQKELGKGGFGAVYYGRLSDGQELAVKIHSELSAQGDQEFKNEIDVLSVVHHKNLVSYMGYCNHGSELILIYEYMSNGTLREHLYGTSNPPLDWKTRLNIALGAAQGLDYLHTACHPQIIHRDVKSSNILLNNAFVPKVADFGLSVLYNKDEASYISTLVKGTIAYLDPEYYALGRLTEKSDVYSFGVVLLEIICGRGPVVSLPEEQVSLIKWVSTEIQKGEIETVVDSKLLIYNKQSMWKVVEVALACTEYESVNRPTMNRVVNELKEAMRFEDTSSLGLSN